MLVPRSFPVRLHRQPPASAASAASAAGATALAQKRQRPSALGPDSLNLRRSAFPIPGLCSGTVTGAAETGSVVVEAVRLGLSATSTKRNNSGSGEARVLGFASTPRR